MQLDIVLRLPVNDSPTCTLQTCDLQGLTCKLVANFTVQWLILHRKCVKSRLSPANNVAFYFEVSLLDTTRK